MAARMEWNANNLRNPGNLDGMRHQINQNQMVNFQVPQQHSTNRFPPRMSPYPPQFNPRFQSQGPGSLSERPDFSLGNNVAHDRFAGGNYQQNEPFMGLGNDQHFPGNVIPQSIQPTMVMGKELPNQTDNQHFNQPPASKSNTNNSTPHRLQPVNSNFLNISRFQDSSSNKQECVQIRNYQEQIIREDEQWLKQWLQGRHMKTKDNPTVTMKICEAQEKTRHMMVLLARLQKNKQLLETLKNENRSIWDQKLKEVFAIKAELEGVQKELTCEENVRQLKTRVEHRKEKRERVKKRKEEMYIQHQEELTERERRSAEIDKAMQQLVEKQKLEKQEKDMQKEADEILSQVRKKLAEANKAKQVVNSLQKLRKLRTDRLERQGVLHMYETQGHSSTNRLMFEAKMSNVTELLNVQLAIYKAEEGALKVHLETEQEETREKEREKARLRMIEKQKQERKKEEKMLFGSQKDPVPGDPLFPFRQYYDSASHSMEALVAIRREWDSYLAAPGTGSYIPENWVLPSEPSSETWTTALESGQLT